jgi:hypothetical protein
MIARSFGNGKPYDDAFATQVVPGRLSAEMKICLFPSIWCVLAGALAASKSHFCPFAA